MCRSRGVSVRSVWVEQAVEYLATRGIIYCIYVHISICMYLYDVT